MKHPIRQRVLLAAFLVVRSLIRWVPLSIAQACGRLLGYLSYALLGPYRRLAFAHLHLALGPQVSRATCARVARGVFVNLAKSFLEWLVMDRLSPTALTRHVDVYGLHYLRDALANRRGAIALSAHFGNWELLAMTLAGLGFEGGVLARRLRYPEFEPFVIRMRARKGVRTYARGSITEVARALRENQIIGMMPDQDVDSLEGVFVDFFDRPAYTPVGPAALSLTTGAPILPCFLIRDGRRFRLVIEEPIAVARSADRAQDLVAITDAWSRVVEGYIRRYPDHWVWMHRRWKTQPSSETSDIPGPPIASHAGAGRHQTSERKRQATHQPYPVAQAVLSLLLVAGHWSLVTGIIGCAKSPQPSKPPQATAGSAPATETPQAMDRFSMAGYSPEGAKEWDLEGHGAVAEGAIVTIRQPHAIGYDRERTSHLTASLAHVDQNSRYIRLEHDVTIHTSDGIWVFMPQMYWLSDREEMRTEEPVRIETDHMLIRGRGASAHANLKTTSVERDIELVMNPSDHDTADEPTSHVTITCDGPLSFEYEKGIATFHENVHVRDRQGDLYADTLIAYVDQTTHTIRYADARGRVRIVQGPRTAHGDRAVYEPALAKVTLLGSPYLVLYPEDSQPAADSSVTAETAPSPLSSGTQQVAATTP